MKLSSCYITTVTVSGINSAPNIFMRQSCYTKYFGCVWNKPRSKHNYEVTLANVAVSGINRVPNIIMRHSSYTVNNCDYVWNKPHSKQDYEFTLTTTVTLSGINRANLNLLSIRVLNKLPE